MSSVSLQSIDQTKLIDGEPRIFDKIKMRSLPQAVRFLVLKVIDILMANHREGSFLDTTTLSMTV